MAQLFYKKTFAQSFKFLLLFVQGVRVQTLPVTLIPIAMTSAFAFQQTEIFQKNIFFFTIVSALFIQISCNFFNDALDTKEENDSSLRIGPPRLTQSKKLSFSQVQNLGFLSCFLAVIFSIPLILKGGIPILILGLISLLFAYLYTGTSFSLLKTGSAELFCFLFFGFAPVIGTYYLQTQSLNFHLIYLGIQCGLWAVTILLINYLRDEQEDLKGGRKHIVTLYGRTVSLLILSLIQIFIYFLCFYWLELGLKAGFFCFFVCPFSTLLIYFLARNKASSKYNIYLALASLFYTLFGGAWIAGLLL